LITIFQTHKQQHFIELIDYTEKIQFAANSIVQTSKFANIRVLPDRVKRGYAFERAEKYILHHIRVLPDWVKRGYAFERAEKHILHHIRVLPDQVKRGYEV
jgi:hypothetical protein